VALRREEMAGRVVSRRDAEIFLEAFEKNID